MMILKNNFVIQLNTMKSNRNDAIYREKEDKKYKHFNIQPITSSPQKNQNRLLEYENLAKKAKDNLKELEIRRRGQQQNQMHKLPERKNQQISRALNSPKSSTKANQYIQSLSNNYSQKYLKQNSPKQSLKQQKWGHEQKKQLQKAISETKLSSPKKKNYVDANEYKKLHEKLDKIENKITDMKKNLQKKRQEKQKLLSQKLKIKQQEIRLTENKLTLNGLVTQMPQQSELHTFHHNPYSPRHNIYYVSELVRAYLDEKSLAREHLVTSLNILYTLQNSKRMSEEELQKVKVFLPRKKGQEDKKTIIFDLDETLIHCKDNLNPPYDAKLPIKFPTGQIIDAAINIRPYAREILKNLSKNFQIIVFTASHSCYANIVLDHLDPEKQWIHHRLYRQHCYLSPEGPYVKDLRIINRDLKDVVLVDNAAYSYAFQLSNGIPILPYYHGTIDFELKTLQQYLKRFLLCKDVRELNDKTFKLHQYREYYNKPEKLVEELYLNK